MSYRRTPSLRSLRVAATAALASVALAACGAGDPKPGPEVAGGNAGVDAQVGADLKVLDVEIGYPADGRYEVGDDASLYLAISNTASSPDTLVDVTGPDFASVRTADGGDVAVPVPGDGTVLVGAAGSPAITLVDLGRALRSSETVPLTLRFDRAGAVTVDAVVDAEGQHPLSDADFSTRTPSRG